MAASAVTAKECLQSAEVCLALAHKTKELDTRAALLEFAYEFRTVAKRLERDLSGGRGALANGAHYTEDAAASLEP